MNRGKLIAKEGLDGCGKKTQSERLVNYLNSIGKKSMYITFPNYGSESSALVKMFLDGKLGDDPTKLSPYAISSMYALDRYISYINEWKKYYDDGYWIVSDRYTMSNMIYQSLSIYKNNLDKGYDKNSKLYEIMNDFYKWVEKYEHEYLGLPVPDKTIFLNMKPENSIRLMKERSDNKHSSKDVYEDNIELIKQIYEVTNICLIQYIKTTIYTDLTSYYISPYYKKFRIINCDEGDKVLGINTIQSKIIEIINNMAEFHDVIDSL